MVKTSVILSLHRVGLYPNLCAKDLEHSISAHLNGVPVQLNPVLDRVTIERALSTGEQHGLVVSKKQRCSHCNRHVRVYSLTKSGFDYLKKLGL